MFILLVLVATCDFAARQSVADVPGAIEYELKSAGKLSAAIYDSSGQIVRELLHAVPRSGGKHVEAWDQLDNLGQPVPAGRYTWKLLCTEGLKATYLMNVGSNYPEDPKVWSNRAPGTHGGPAMVAADASGIYIGAGCTENIENMLVKLSPDGSKRLWSSQHVVAWKGAGQASCSARNCSFSAATEWSGSSTPKLASICAPSERSPATWRTSPASRTR